MNKRLAIAISEDYHAEIGRQLSRQSNMGICGLVDFRPLPDRSLMSDDGFFWTMNYVVSLHDLHRDLSFSSIHIPANILIILKRYEHIFLRITDRLTYRPCSTMELSRLYYKFCRVWFDAYRGQKIDAVIFFSTPHMGFDFVGYVVAKALAVDVRIINRTGFGLSSRITTDIDLWNDKKKHHFRLKKNNQLISLEKEINFDISVARSSSAIRSVLSQHKNQLSFIREFFRLLVNGARHDLVYIAKRLFLQRPQKESFHWISGPRQGIQTPSRLLRAIRTRALFKYYRKICLKEPPQGPYILFAAHFQPERSTTPEGGCFDDHLNAISALLSCLPDGLCVVYKEHPRSFDIFDMRRQFVRSRAYYESLNSCNNVKLVDSFYDNSQLIKKAVAVVTVTGTSGWEALKLSKPCVIFGDAWYRECRSCLHISELDAQSLLRLLEKSEDNVDRDLREFIQDVSCDLVWAPNSSVFANASKDPLPLNCYVESMASAVAESLGFVQGRSNIGD